jgi:hypothetical protein
MDALSGDQLFLHISQAISFLLVCLGCRDWESPNRQRYTMKIGRELARGCGLVREDESEESPNSRKTTLAG